MIGRKDDRAGGNRRVGDVVLGIDLGSTWCKAAYLDSHGHVVARGRAYTHDAPAFGFSVDHLQTLWSAVRHSVRDASDQLRSCARVPALAAIALSSRSGIGLWLDDNDRPIGIAPGELPHSTDPAMVAVYAHPAWDLDGLCTYAPLLVGRTVWLRQHRPQEWMCVRRVGALHDWMLFRLTGRWATNPATGPGRLTWPHAASELSGLPLSAFPDVVGFDTSVGPLTPDAAADLGLPPLIPVAAGYHDGAAAAVGTGVLEPGDTCITLGTSAALRVAAQRPVRGWFGYPITEDRWVWMRGVSRAVAEVDEVVAELDAAIPMRVGVSHAALAAEAATIPPGSGGLSLPLSVARRTEDLRVAVHTACTAGYSAGTIYRAALEGVALRMRDLADLARCSGVVPQRCIATGGGARNDLLLRILSAVLAMPVERGDIEAGARGAALAAAVAAGWYPTIASAAARMHPTHKHVFAQPSETATYAALAATRGSPASTTQTLPLWRCLPT